MKRTVLIGMVSIFVFTGILTVDFSAASVDFDCKRTLDTKCVECHYKTRICQALGKKSTRKWLATISAMVRKGMVLSRPERVKLAECLSSAEPGSKIVCD